MGYHDVSLQLGCSFFLVLENLATNCFPPFAIVVMIVKTLPNFPEIRMKQIIK